jgi:hypothetical protein
MLGNVKKMFGNIGHLKKLEDINVFSSNGGMLRKCWGTMGMLKRVLGEHNKM